MPPKHRLDKEGVPTAEETSQKRRRHGKSALQVIEDMEEKMDSVNNVLPPEYAMRPGVSGIPRGLLEDGTSAETLLAQLGGFKRFCQARLRAVSIKVGELTSGEDINQKLLCRKFIEGQFILSGLISTADELQSTLFSKPSPSAYAEASVWREVQTYPNPILNLRPTGKQGLPLTILHPIFSQFRLLSRLPLPNSSAGANALRAAMRLCSRMGDAFDNEKDRGKTFDRAMAGFLQGVGTGFSLHGHEVSREVGRIYHLAQRCVIFREDKVEIGTGGDAYTQVARTYDLACEQMKENDVTPDAPVFLLCVMGPTLTIAGGFKDGNDTVVEPLCSMLFMLKDMDNVNGRAVQLATHLFALHSCLQQLPHIPTAPSPVPGVPRVFPSFQDAQGIEHNLTFRQRISEDLLLFDAVDDMSRNLFVKVVYRPYGEEVHRSLAREKMAPDLLGVSSMKGGPTMIVMEMLDKSWQTLYTFAQMNSRWSSDGVQPAIRKRLEEILTKLKGEGFVHGDFRASNIMVKPGEEESAMVIDFDWAGKDGEVNYPLARNNEGIQWPGEAGGAILSAHDRFMLETEWDSLLEPWTV